MAQADDTTPSEVALLVAGLLPTLPPQTVRDLQALIAQRLTFVGAAEAREARLGLLLDLVAVSGGEIPATADYEDERARRRKQGEVWPNASVLSRAYNGWPRACLAAMRLHFRSGAGVSVEHPQSRKKETFTRAEMLQAIVRFADAHEQRWPTYTEFFVWRRDLRQRARLSGSPSPRVPAPGDYRKYFANFPAAVRTARRLREPSTSSGRSRA